MNAFLKFLAKTLPSFAIILFAFVASGQEKLVQCDGVTSQCDVDAFVALLVRVMNYLLFAFALPVAAVLFAYAGFLYVTAQGNEGQVSSAHKIFANVLIGFTLALGAWLIVNALVGGLGVDAPFKLFLK